MLLVRPAQLVRRAAKFTRAASDRLRDPAYDRIAGEPARRMLRVIGEGASARPSGRFDGTEAFVRALQLAGDRCVVLLAEAKAAIAKTEGAPAEVRDGAIAALVDAQFAAAVLGTVASRVSDELGRMLFCLKPELFEGDDDEDHSFDDALGDEP